MPKRGNDRQSSRDDARGQGAPGGDEDYAWIKYLGEGRAAPSSAGGSAQTNGGWDHSRLSAAQRAGTQTAVGTGYAPPAEPAYQPPRDPYYGRRALPAAPDSPSSPRSPSRELARRPTDDQRNGGGNGRYGGTSSGY